MMIFARPSGSGYPNQLEAIIPYGSTKAYSQRPTLFTRIFHIPLTRLTWLVWKNPIGYTDKMRKSKAEQSAQTRYTHRRNQVHGQSVRKSICPSAPVGPVSRCKYLRYDTAITPYTVILLPTKGIRIFGTYLMLEPKE